MARMPRELEVEKAMLVAAMLLAKKVANVVPDILQQVFNTTVNYIDQNLHDYVNNLGPEVIIDKITILHSSCLSPNQRRWLVGWLGNSERIRPHVLKAAKFEKS